MPSSKLPPPGGGPVDSDQTIIQLLCEIRNWLHVPTVLDPLVMVLPTDGSSQSIMNPMPTGVRMLAITNTGSQTAYAWFYQATSKPLNASRSNQAKEYHGMLRPRYLYMSATKNDAQAGCIAEIWTLPGGP